MNIEASPKRDKTMTKAVTLRPLVVTAETLQLLAKQENYANLLALYMAYAEITSWQGTNNIKATREFMANRLHWRKDKVSKLRGELIKLGLIEPISRKNESGQVVGHYVLIRHIVSENHAPHVGAAGFEEPLDLGATNTNNYNKNTNNYNKSAGRDINERAKDSTGPAEHQTFFKKPKKSKNALAQGKDVCAYFTEQNGGSYNNRLHIEAATEMCLTHGYERVIEVAHFALNLKDREYQVKVRTPVQLADKWAAVVKIMETPDKDREKDEWY